MEWLNYHHLLYFWMVAREGGLAPAGKALRLSQSALSGQIKRLEEVLGHPLFERRGRRLELTETGRIAFKYADEIFGLGRELMNTIRARPSDRTPRLTVGISDVVPKLLVRTLLQPAFRLDERLLLTCHEDRFDRLLVDLAAHTVDVVIADAPIPTESEVKAFNHLLGDSTVTLVAPGALGAALRRGFPDSLQGAPLLLPTHGSNLRRNIDAWLDRAGITAEVVAEAEDSALLKAFAAEGMGAMFVPTAIAKIVCHRYDLVHVHEVTAIREHYYAISAQRRLVHPAVIAIRDAARDALFA
ncbi:MAG: LysR family transcriptional regulator [Kofleriaceae bacterium]|nr:LysR family transcriptional regulator [Kofleriaceae bacterium]